MRFTGRRIRWKIVHPDRRSLTSGSLHLNLHTMSPHAKSAKTRRREVRVAPPNWNPSRPSRLRVRGQSSAHWDHQNKVKRSTSTPIPNYQILLTPCSGPGARPHPGGVDFPPARPGQWTVVGITLGGGGRGGGSPPPRTRHETPVPGAGQYVVMPRCGAGTRECQVRAKTDRSSLLVSVLGIRNRC